jgi:hypothetical protein
MCWQMLASFPQIIFSSDTTIFIRRPQSQKKFDFPDRIKKEDSKTQFYGPAAQGLNLECCPTLIPGGFI